MSGRVRIYFNSTKKTFSIKQRGKVIGHADKITLVNCKFIVSQKAHDYVVRTGKKTPHAYIEGEIPTSDTISYNTLTEQEVRYNPFTCDRFMTQDGKAVHWAKYVVMEIMDKKACVVAGF